MELKTPLYDMHVKYKGKIVPFAGYLLPVQYEKGVIAEHMAVILLSGPDALKNVNMLLTNDYTVMEDGTARYSPMCNEAGGVVDDLIVYKIKDNSYFIVVNASNKDKDYQWMKDHVSGDVELKDIPKALDVLKKVADPDAIPDKYYTFKKDCCIDGIPCIISKTGYTGEDGVEIYMAGNDAPRLWELLLEAGREEGLIPCGLGARDTLRLEASMPLYGHEMDDTITPKEAGLGIFVKMDKEDFIGKKALQEKGPLTRKRVGLKVFAGEQQIGTTTSGTHCPYLGYPAAMALVDIAYKEPGTQVEVDVRGRRVGAEVVKLPFYKREK